MADKEIEIILAKADFFKIICIGTGGYGLIELVRTQSDLGVNINIWVAFGISAFSLAAMVLFWREAEKANDK